MLNTTQLRQDRQKIIEEMRALHDGVIERAVEKPEETESLAKMEKDIRALEVAIDREETIAKFEAEKERALDKARETSKAGEFPGIRYPVNGVRTPSREEMERRVSVAIQGWLKRGKASEAVTEEHVQAAQLLGIDLNSREIDLPIRKDYRAVKNEFRHLNITSSTKGQETIPEGFVNSLEQALLTFGGVRQVAEVMRTDSGNALPWPTSNDTTNKGEIISEATTFGSSVDPAFSQVIFHAFKYSSKAILISPELLQDSAFDLGAVIGNLLGQRIGRIQNDHFTTGTDTTMPNGIVVAATLGKAATDNTSFTADEVIDLEHSVDPAYRPGAQWMMHDTVLAAVRKLKETSTNNYLWQPGLQANVPDRLLGYTYQINQSMASSLISSAKVMLFGDLSKYKVRDVATIRLRRLDELYAQTDQVGFVAFMRSDGDLLDAGTHPVKYLQLAAS